MNEILFFSSILLFFSSLLLCQVLFGKYGIYAWIVMAMSIVNIGVLKLVTLFGFEMTLGNVLFCTTMFATDLLGERFGKKAAYRAVPLGFLGGLGMVIVSQIWLAYTPSQNDFIAWALAQVFELTPRIVIASLLVFLICEYLDIFFYHKIWACTTKRLGDTRKALWLRNNGTRLISQTANNVLFNTFAFYGLWDNKTLVSIIAVSLALNLFISLLDTPFAYIARRLPSGICIKDDD